MPSFMGEPREVKISDDIEKFALSLWDEIGEDYRVAMYVRFYDSKFATYEDRIFNTNTL